MANGNHSSYPKEYPKSIGSDYPKSNLNYVRSLKKQHQGRILFANFPVNSASLTKEHEVALRQVVKFLKSNLFAYIPIIEGRTSQTGPEKNNEKLSSKRVAAVINYIVRMGARRDQMGSIKTYGSKAPIEDRPGQELGVNRSVLLYYSLPKRIAFPKRKKPVPKKTGTDLWAIRLKLSGGASYGIGGAFALGELKNQITEKVMQGSFQGGGIGVGLQTPGADPDWGSWSYFKTDAKYTFEDFDGTLARLTAYGVGFFIGYTHIWLSFPNLGANSIDVSGLNLGSVGADASSNVGTWNVIGM